MHGRKAPAPLPALAVGKDRNLWSLIDSWTRIQPIQPSCERFSYIFICFWYVQCSWDATHCCFRSFSIVLARVADVPMPPCSDRPNGISSRVSLACSHDLLQFLFWHLGTSKIISCRQYRIIIHDSWLSFMGIYLFSQYDMRTHANGISEIRTSFPHVSIAVRRDASKEPTQNTEWQRKLMAASLSVARRRFCLLPKQIARFPLFPSNFRTTKPFLRKWRV